MAPVYTLNIYTSINDIIPSNMLYITISSFIDGLDSLIVATNINEKNVVPLNNIIKLFKYEPVIIIYKTDRIINILDDIKNIFRLYVFINNKTIYETINQNILDVYKNDAPLPKNKSNKVNLYILVNSIGLKIIELLKILFNIISIVHSSASSLIFK